MARPSGICSGPSRPWTAAEAPTQTISPRTNWATVHIWQLLGRLSAAEAPLWGDAVEILNDLKTAQGKEAEGEPLAELERIVHAGADAAQNQEATWEEVCEVITEPTRTAAVEWERLANLRALIEVEKALAVVRSVLETDRNVVTDREQFWQLNARMLELLRPPGEHGVIEAEPD